MKKITTLIIGFFLSSVLCHAAGDWATSAISLVVNDGDATYYKLNDAGWTSGSWSEATPFAVGFGTVTSFILNGAAGNAWTDDSPGYDGASFKLYYRVYKAGTTAGAWATLDLDNESFVEGNNRIYDKMDAAIDLVALATEEGLNEYTFEVVMSKDQDYGTGSWNSMIPTGQATAYSADSSGYMATFSVNNVPTPIEEVNASALSVSSYNNQLSLAISSSFNQDVSVVLVNMLGQVTSTFSSPVQSGNNTIVSPQSIEPGVYVLQVNMGSDRLIKKITIQ